MTCCDQICVFAEEGSALNKIKIAASINKLCVCPKTPSSASAEEQEHLKYITPLGIFPAIAYPGGSAFGVNGVLRTIARAKPLATCCCLYGRFASESGAIDGWLDMCEEQLEPNVNEIVGQVNQSKHFNPKSYQESLKVVKGLLNKIEKHIAPRTFIVGERCSMADMSLAVTLSPLFSTVFGPEDRKGLVNVSRWISTILGTCVVQAVMGEFKFAEKAQEPPKPEKTKKPEKPKAAKEKPKEEPKEEPEEESEEEPEPVEDPNAPLDMDWWKRLYSNTKPAQYPQMWPLLWKKIEADKGENFSAYFCKFLDPEQFDHAFKLSNTISGFFQRLDAARKITFGSQLILGTSGDLHSQGVWLFAKPEMPKEMSECPMFESFGWTKADLSKPEDRKLFEEYCEWEGSFGGLNKEVNDGKIFK
jgi:elongation factor 1-gamma